MGKNRTEDRTDGRTRKGTYAPGVSGNPSGPRPRAHDTGPSVADPRYDVSQIHGNPAALAPRAHRQPTPVDRRDDWMNALTGQGVYGRDKRLGGIFQTVTLQADQLKDLWLGDDLAARAVETVPKEAKRAGYDLTISDPGESSTDASELAGQVKDELARLGADDAIEVAGNYERGYGGGVIVLGCNDKQADLTKPLDLNKVVSLDWLSAREPRDCMPLRGYGDPMSAKFNQPEIYRLLSRSILPSSSRVIASGSVEIHESRLIVFPGIRVSAYQTSFGRSGWGEAVLSRVWRVLRDFNTAWAAAGTLVSDFGQTVIKMKELWDTLARDDGKTFAKRLEMMELGRSFNNALTIDSEDSWERQTTSLAGLPDLLQQFATRLAAACDMPLTLLFGTSPAGMNATGESDIRFFYDKVEAYRQGRLMTAYRKLVEILFRVVGNKRAPKKWSLKFRPLWQESAKDQAAAMLTQAQADNTWITASVITAEEVAAAHWGKGEYDPNLSIDFAAREAGEQAAAGPVTLEDRKAMTPDPDDYTPPPSEPGVPDKNTPPLPRANEDRHDDDRDDDFNPDQPRDSNGKFGSGGGESPSTERSWTTLGHLAGRASEATEKLARHAEKLTNAQTKHAESKAAARTATKAARTASARAARMPTEANVAAAKLATAKAVKAETQLDKHTVVLAQRAEAHAKAQTGAALANVRLREAQRQTAPKTPLPEARPMQGIGFERIAGEHDHPEAQHLTETPEFHFGAGMGRIAGESDHPGVVSEPSRPAPEPREAARVAAAAPEHGHEAPVTTARSHVVEYVPMAPAIHAAQARPERVTSQASAEARQTEVRRQREVHQANHPEPMFHGWVPPKAETPGLLSRAAGSLKKFLRINKDGTEEYLTEVELRRDGDWNEGDHPRAANGEFGEGGGASRPTSGAASLTPREHLLLRSVSGKAKGASFTEAEKQTLGASIREKMSQPASARLEWVAAAVNSTAAQAKGGDDKSQAKVAPRTKTAAEPAVPTTSTPAPTAPKAVAPVPAKTPTTASASKTAAVAAPSVKTAIAAAQTSAVQRAAANDPRRDMIAHGIVAATPDQLASGFDPRQWSGQAQSALRAYHDAVVTPLALHNSDVQLPGHNSAIAMTDKAMMIGTAQCYGMHSGGGAVSLRSAVVENMRAHAALDPSAVAGLGAKSLAGDENARKMIESFRVSTHESLHGFGPRVVTNGRNGTMIDEVTTELVARHVTAEVHGLQAHQMDGSYDRMIRPIVDAVAEMSGKTKEDAYNALTKSSIDFKRLSTERASVISAEVYAKAGGTRGERHGPLMEHIGTTALKSLGVNDTATHAKLYHAIDEIDMSQSKYDKLYPSTKDRLK